MRKKLLFLFLSATSVFLLSRGFNKELYWWVSFFALVPFFVLISRAKNKKRAFFGGWFVGFLFFLFNLNWFLGPHFAWWGGSEDLLFAMIVFSFAWAGSAGVLGLSFGVFAPVFFVVSKTKVSPAPARDTFVFSAIFLPSIWIILEYLRSWLFCFWSWGSESIFGPYWTFGHLGYTLVNSPFSVLARHFGLYGLSFLVVLINLLIFKKKFRVLFALLLFVFVFVSFVAKDYQSGKIIRADLLQAENSNVYYGTVTRLLEDTPLPARLSARQENSSRLFRVVVFPEGSNFFSTKNPEADILLPHLFSENENGLVISSAVFKDVDLKYEYVLYADKDGNILEKQKKNFLISAGEYMPYVIQAPLKFFSFEEQVFAFNSTRYFERGDEPEKPFYFKDTGFGSLVCSGILSPVFYRKLAKDGAEVLVNSASHQTFGYSPKGLFHVRTFARFQAIANARPFLQSVFGGHAFIIDANGNFTAGDFKEGTKFVSGEVEIISKKTPYTKWGDWFLVCAFFFVLFGVYFGFGYNKRDGKNGK